MQVISKYFTTSAQPTSPENTDRIQPTCYDMAMPTQTVISPREDLNKRLNTLEKQYKEKKIDEKTYKQSKENITKLIESLKDK